MQKIAVIGGTVLFESDIFKDARLNIIKTRYGTVEVYSTEDIFLIQRHRLQRDTPPHRINYQANIIALKKLGVEKIISLNSSGSLKMKIKPLSIVIPHDFIGLWNLPTVYNHRIKHIAPSFDEKLRQTIIAAAKKINLKVVPKGIYVQCNGPRYETKAEIQMLRHFGDIVGMTAASEATIANEVGIGYATICSVDNYANGLTKKPLRYEDTLVIVKQNQKNLLQLLDATMERLI